MRYDGESKTGHFGIYLHSILSLLDCLSKKFGEQQIEKEFGFFSDWNQDSETNIEKKINYPEKYLSLFKSIDKDQLQYGTQNELLEELIEWFQKGINANQTFTYNIDD